MTERYCEGERFTGLSFAGEIFESCDFADCVFVDCSFTKCELDHTMLNESSATVAGHSLHRRENSELRKAL